MLLIACCYWKRANNWGAYAAIVVGAALPVTFLAMNLKWRVPVIDPATHQQLIGPDGAPAVKPYLVDRFGPTVTHWINIGTYCATALCMLIGSLLKPGAGVTVPAEDLPPRPTPNPTGAHA